MHRIDLVGERNLPELLPLMRAYCDFYRVSPPDGDLLEMSRALLADSEREGLQLIGRDGQGRAVGFATIFWSWSTLSAALARELERGQHLRRRTLAGAHGAVHVAVPVS